MLATEHLVTRKSSLEAGFRQMYNLNFQQPIRRSRRGSSFIPIVHSALRRMPQLTCSMNSSDYVFWIWTCLPITIGLDSMENLLPDPKIKIAFENELTKADDLASKILAQSSNDLMHCSQKPSLMVYAAIMRHWLRSKNGSAGFPEIVPAIAERTRDDRSGL